MKKAEREQLNRNLSNYLNTVHETLQVLDRTADSSLDKVNWDDVFKMGEQVSKQATLVGMLWIGEKPQAKAIEENMSSYFNVLQGFLLLSHGSTVGAGPTLSSNINAVVKNVVDRSFVLWKNAISSCGTPDNDGKVAFPQLVGAVWEACSALKKTPTTNVIAIGRAMTQVAVSVKDVLREMKDLKSETTNLTEDNFDQADNDGNDTDNSSECVLGNDLSPEEMKIVQSAIHFVSQTLVVIKELVRFITGLFKRDNSDGGNFLIDALEKLLNICKDISLQIDEVGASLYPPQEPAVIGAALENISRNISEMQAQVETLEGSSNDLFQACNCLRNALADMESEFNCFTAEDLVPQVENLAVSN